MTIPSHPSFRLYGRRKGRPLRARKAGLAEKLLPQLKITLPKNIGADACAALTDLSSLFSFRPEGIWLEIGFGGGEHLAAQAGNHPATGFIGCEAFSNGVANLCDHIDKGKIGNIRIFPDDARVFLDAAPDRSVDRCFILFPDPWPKARHAERRFINAANLARLARVMRTGAELRLATDDARLVAWIRECLAQSSAFRMMSDTAMPPADGVETRYEQKAIKAGRKPVYMTWIRI